MTETIIRDLSDDDIEIVDKEFSSQGWGGRGELCKKYLLEQRSNSRDVIGIFCQEDFCGYVTIVWKSGYPHFNQKNIPEISDLNVLLKYRGNGFGYTLMSEAERRIFDRGSVAGLGVGLLPDYGSAQKLYIKLGYIPDGLGVTYQHKTCEYGDKVIADDDLCLWLSKSKLL